MVRSKITCGLYERKPCVIFFFRAKVSGENHFLTPKPCSYSNLRRRVTCELHVTKSQSNMSQSHKVKVPMSKCHTVTMSQRYMSQSLISQSQTFSPKPKSHACDLVTVKFDEFGDANWLLWGFHLEQLLLAMSDGNVVAIYFVLHQKQKYFIAYF